MFFGGFPFDEDSFSGGRGGPRREVENSKMYEILGVSKTASPDEIKKAYRALAKKHHPDKGGDPEQFKLLSKAHEILSDPEKRRTYDEYGEEGLENGGGGGHDSDIIDLLMGGGRRGGGRGRKRKGSDVMHPVPCTLEQLYSGSTRKMSITRNVVCLDCDGKGGPEDAIEMCRACNGRGIRVKVQQMGGMIQQSQAACTACRQRGSIMPDARKCKKCAGNGSVKDKKILEVWIEKGAPQGSKVTFGGEADQRPGETAGDVIFMIEQQNHHTFERKGADLIMRKDITLYEALTGFKFCLTHLDNRKIVVESPPGMITKPGTPWAVKEEGMPVYKAPYQKGNLFIVFEVIFPETVDELAATALQKVLPLPKALAFKPGQDDVEVREVQFIDPEESQKQSQRAMAEAYHEDDDQGMGGQRVMQCRQS